MSTNAMRQAIIQHCQSHNGKITRNYIIRYSQIHGYLPSDAWPSGYTFGGVMQHIRYYFRKQELALDRVNKSDIYELINSMQSRFNKSKQATRKARTHIRNLAKAEVEDRKRQIRSIGGITGTEVIEAFNMIDASYANFIISSDYVINQLEQKSKDRLKIQTTMKQ